MPEPTIFRRELSLSISYFPQTGRSCNSVHWLSPAACISQSQSKPQLLQGSGLTSPKLAPYNSYYFLPVEPKPPRDSLLSLVHSSKSIAGWCFIILNCATLSFIKKHRSPSGRCWSVGCRMASKIRLRTESVSLHVTGSRYSPLRVSPIMHWCSPLSSPRVMYAAA